MKFSYERQVSTIWFTAIDCCCRIKDSEVTELYKSKSLSIFVELNAEVTVKFNDTHFLNECIGNNLPHFNTFLPRHFTFQRG